MLLSPSSELSLDGMNKLYLDFSCNVLATACDGLPMNGVTQTGTVSWSSLHYNSNQS